ncbi:MAG: DoxX family membrane protein [Chloroflexota bacterium]
MSLDLGLFLLRLVIGSLLFAHGAQKLFGWFGGPGLAGTVGMFGGYLRLRPARLWAILGGLSELGGGLLLAAGLFGPLGAAAVMAAMLMALTVHWPSFWAQDRGIEYPLTLLVVALALAVTGPGSLSLDAVLGLQLSEPLTLVVSLTGVLVGVGLALGTRAPADAPATQEPAAAS